MPNCGYLKKLWDGEEDNESIIEIAILLAEIVAVIITITALWVVF